MSENKRKNTGKTIVENWLWLEKCTKLKGVKVK